MSTFRIRGPDLATAVTTHFPCNKSNGIILINSNLGLCLDCQPETSPAI